MVTDPFAELESAVEGDVLHAQLKRLYEENQVPDIRYGVHLSDLTAPLTYRGKPRFCYRRVILSAHYHPEEKLIPHPKVAIFERGKDMHFRWQQKFRRAGVVVNIGDIQGIEATHEVVWLFPNRSITDGDWRLLFTPDVIIDIGNGPEIVELKGYNTLHYTKLLKTPSIPPEDATFQASLYMALTGIKSALIIVECKDNQKFHVWRIGLNMDVIKPFEERVLTVDALDNAFRTAGQLPKRVCNAASDELALECPMRRVCFAESTQRNQYLMRLVAR